MYVDVRPSSFTSTVSMAVITIVACTVSWVTTPPMLWNVPRRRSQATARVSALVLDATQLAISPSLTGENLHPLLEAGGDLRMQVSNGAVASLADTLPLLHPFSYLLCHDLFLTDAGQYGTGFRGPGKYDGSVVSWVNGPLLAQIGGRRGFDVSFEPFRHRAGSNVKTLTVRTRD